MLVGDLPFAVAPMTKWLWDLRALFHFLLLQNNGKNVIYSDEYFSVNRYCNGRSYRSTFRGVDTGETWPRWRCQGTNFRHYKRPNACYRRVQEFSSGDHFHSRWQPKWWVNISCHIYKKKKQPYARRNFSGIHIYLTDQTPCKNNALRYSFGSITWI